MKLSTKELNGKEGWKLAGYTCLVIFVLSLTVADKPIFHYVYSVISPVTKWTQDAAATLGRSTFAAGKAFTSELMGSSVDSVKSRVAAPARGEPLENIPHDEKEKLGELIKSHR